MAQFLETATRTVKLEVYKIAQHFHQRGLSIGVQCLKEHLDDIHVVMLSVMPQKHCFLFTEVDNFKLKGHQYNIKKGHFVNQYWQTTTVTIIPQFALDIIHALFLKIHTQKKRKKDADH